MKKLNNKGFSLVELIVVIAIMAILAVTLAPRLTAYVEKSRKASDGEVVNAVMTATRLGVLEEDIKADFDALLTAGSDTIDLVADDIYTTADGKTFTKGTALDEFSAQLYEIVGEEFTLKSADTQFDATGVTTTTIKIVYDGTGEIEVAIYYDGTNKGYSVTDRY